MNRDNHDASHPATATRLLQAQQSGQVAKSQELASSIQLVAGMVLIYLTIQMAGSQLVNFTHGLWSETTIEENSAAHFNQTIETAAIHTATLVLPWLLAIALVSIFSHLLQNPGSVANPQSIFRSEAFNPLVGIQRLLSNENLFRSTLGIPKIALLCIIFVTSIWSLRTDFANLSFQPVNTMLSGMVDAVFTVLMLCAATLLVTSLADYLLERFAMARRLRMSDQELRDENRLQQVDPQISSRRQQLYQQWLDPS